VQGIDPEFKPQYHKNKTKKGGMWRTKITEEGKRRTERAYRGNFKHIKVNSSVS
jgi:hypothetical protein